MTIRQLQPTDLAAAQSINEGNLSDVDAIALADLERVLTDAKIALAAVEPEGSVVGFCLIIDSRCGYLSQRAQWAFDTAGPGLHIDRVVFDMRFSGFGLGLALYNELDARLASLAPTTLTSLVRTGPPNEHSVGFHAKRGFETIAHTTFRGQQFALTQRAY